MRRLIRWLLLDLEGFGVWREPTRFRFPDGLGVLTLPNERGKSTLVAGLRSVLFGLPDRSDPAVPGIGRYRSWGGSVPCRGRLDLQVDDRIIRIRRDIDSHKTNVDEIDAAESSRYVLFEGTANPAGRTPTRGEYEALLRQLLGDLADEELFAATFLIEQPVLPTGRMGESLRKLVSGVGRVGGEEARRVLFEEVRSLTRATGDLGLIAPDSTRPANQRTDGQIEKLKAEIDRLGSRRDEVARAFEAQRELQEKLQQADGMLETAVDAEAHARADRDQLISFRKNLDARDESLKARDELKAVLDRYDAEAAEAERIQAQRARDYPDLSEAPPDLESTIEEALSREAHRDAAVKDLERWKQEVQGRQETQEEAARAAAADPDLLDRPDDFIARVKELHEAAERLRRIEEQRAGIMADRESNGRILASQDRWRRIFMAQGGGSDAVAWMARARAAAERWREVVARLLEIETKLKGCLAARERFAAVAVLPEDVEEALARLQETLRDLDERESIAARAEDSQRILAEDIVLRREEFDRRYAALDGVEEIGFLRILEGRSAQHRRIHDLEEDATRLRAELAAGPGPRRWSRAIALGVPVGIAASAIALASRLPPLVAILGGLLLLTVTVLVLLARPSRSLREAQRGLAACERETDELRTRLRLEFLPSGPWLPDDAHTLERAREIFRQRDLDAESLARSEESLADPAALTDAEMARRQSRGARERLEIQAKQIEEATGLSAAEAIREYRRLSAELQGLESQLEAARCDVLGADSTSGPEPEASLAIPLSILSSNWQILAEAAVALDLGTDTLQELNEKLASLTVHDWDAWEAGLRAFSGASTAVEELDRRLGEIDAPDASGLSERERLASRIAILRGECAPFDPETDLEALTERWGNHRQEREALVRARHSLADAGQELQRGEEKRQDMEAKLQALRMRLGPERLAASEESLARLRERLRAHQDLLHQMEWAREEAEGLLASARGGPFADRTALAAEFAAEDDRRRDAQRSMDESAEASDLVRTYRDADPLARDRVRREVETRAENATAALESARPAREQAHARLAAWQPPVSVNLAAIDLEVSGCREALAVLCRRRDATARAWHLLGEAIDEFRSAHREALQEALDSRFRAITGRSTRRVLLDPKLEVEIVEDGVNSIENQLSQGARDQLAFCLRLAVADLVAGEILLPLILDDPFVHSDHARLERIRAALEQASRDRQILLLTQDERLSEWGSPIVAERYPAAFPPGGGLPLFADGVRDDEVDGR